MPLFTGHAEITIDAKSRLAIPARFRAVLDAQKDGVALYSVAWKPGRLLLFPEKAFEAMANYSASLTPSEDEADFDTDYFGQTERLEMDSAGRVTLPRVQLELTGLPPDVVVIGARTRLEVRDRQAWAQGRAERFRKLPDLAARLTQLRTDAQPGAGD
jgi:MraZ protein